MTSLTIIESVAQRILLLRNKRVMLDADLAKMYGMPARALNQAVLRNMERFPTDFMFQLSRDEKTEVVTSCDHLAKLVSLLVVRTFVLLCEMLSSNKERAIKLLELERKTSSRDQAIAGLIDAIRQLMKQPVGASRPIGFTANTKGSNK